MDGVNVHLRLNYLNSPVTASPSGGLSANPLYYGMLLVARTLGPGATLMNMPTTAASQDLSVRGVRDIHGTLRVLLVNTSASDVVVKNRLGIRGDGTVIRLTAASPSATTDVQFAGRTLNSAGQWVGAARAERVRGPRGVFTVASPGTARRCSPRPSECACRRHGARPLATPRQAWGMIPRTPCSWPSPGPREPRPRRSSPGRSRAWRRR